MVSRCVILALKAALLNLPWILEQPASSLLQYHPDFQYLAKKTTIYRVSQLYEVVSFVKEIHGKQPSTGHLSYEVLSFVKKKYMDISH